MSPYYGYKDIPYKISRGMIDLGYVATYDGYDRTAADSYRHTFKLGQYESWLNGWDQFWDQYAQLYDS